MEKNKENILRIMRMSFKTPKRTSSTNEKNKNKQTPRIGLAMKGFAPSEGLRFETPQVLSTPSGPLLMDDRVMI